MRKMIIGLLTGVLAACMQLKYADDDEQIGTNSLSSSHTSSSSSSIYSKLKMGKLDTNFKKGISYYKAITWCNKMSLEEKLDSLYQYDEPDYVDVEDSTFWLPNIRILEGRSGYRLPTKEEWEWASKSGEITDVDKNIGEWLYREANSQYSTFELAPDFSRAVGLYRGSMDGSLVYGMRAVKIY